MFFRAALALQLAGGVAFGAPPEVVTPPAPESAGRVKSPELALTLAESAFEYRDFAKVIEFLDPWVHPPQILDPEKLQKARELLGISHHLLGRSDRAKEEFEQVLLNNPDHALDTFVVPPAVIATFEETREAMKSLLERRRRELQLEAETRAKQDISGTHPLAVLAPFGLSHYLVLNRPAWGSLWLITQLLGLGANVGGFWAARSIMDGDGVVQLADESSYRAATAVQYVGIGLFVASWAASAIHGAALLSAAPEAEVAPEQTPAPPVLSLGFSPTSLHVSF